ncbi:hypothetical protein ES288_A06G096100v1 [Gossypium darwinii]|uniref:Pectate lyase superfamily protein domain-containing protein n=1 Tax=Gossypium darwinii TaxID=34276 RepID=A0A5D2G6X0_GOSDA|nr:hypothetical protein ES288_A06G096100v1 [Gossypium darwinii]
MAPHLHIVPSMFVLLLLFISAPKGQSDAIDVVAKFGAKADGKTNLSKASSIALNFQFLDAWKVAYASVTPSTVVIPKGTYLLTKVNLEGPCKAPIEINDPNWVRFYSIENFKMSSRGIFDGQGSIAYEKNTCDNREFRSKLPVNIRFEFVTNALIQDISSKDSKLFHVIVFACKNITLEHGTKNVDIKEVTCGPGHGISIGSLGKFRNEEPVEGIKVSNYTITNTSNGARIKTWPGEYPRIEESKVKLSNISFKNIRGTSALPEAVKFICSGYSPCQNVELADIDIKHTGAKPATSQCLNVKPITSGKLNPIPCSSPVPKTPSATA